MSQDATAGLINSAVVGVDYVAPGEEPPEVVPQQPKRKEQAVTPEEPDVPPVPDPEPAPEPVEPEPA